MRAMIEAFAQAGIPDPALDARLLLCAAADIAHIDLIRHPDTPLEEEACGRLKAFWVRRLRREPVSRILGRRGFWSLDLLVTPDVLDPRPDSETLIDAALEALAERQDEPLVIADLGTGSGALLCALLDIFPHAAGVAVDVSAKACAVARRNLTSCSHQGRFDVREGGWDAAGPGPYDLIVSNPPYIRSGDIAGLASESRDFDPLLALDGGADGLDAYRAILAVLPGMLKPGGLAILEIGFDQAEDVSALIAQASLKMIGLRHDYGGNPRAILAIRDDKKTDRLKNRPFLL